LQQALALALIFLGMSAIAILSGDPAAAPVASDAYAASEGLAVFFRRVCVPYYRFLFTRRNPTLLGAACGFLLGTLLSGPLKPLPSSAWLKPTTLLKR
jgi:hypothetical protein